MTAAMDATELMERYARGEGAAGLELERRAKLYDRFGEALEEIRDRDWVENCLDPQWAAERAADALHWKDREENR